MIFNLSQAYFIKYFKFLNFHLILFVYFNFQKLFHVGFINVNFLKNPLLQNHCISIKLNLNS